MLQILKSRESKQLQQVGLKSKRWQVPLATCAVLVTALLILDALFPLAEPLTKKPAQRVLATNGEPLRNFGDENGIHRYLIANQEVSPFYIQALLAYEDRWFYQHYGVNPLAIGRASLQWLQHGKVISGASTLTMQVARLLHPHPKTLTGKLTQALRAMQLEWHYSKAEILNLYINLAPFGGNLEGVEAASRFYFNKPALALNQSESALLVALPQRPSHYRPDRYPVAARLARNKVLERLTGLALLSSKQARRLAADPIQSKRYPTPLMAPLLAQHLVQQEATQPVVKTYLDIALQSRVEKLLQHVKHQLPPKSSAAILIAENKTHRVIAYRGSLDFRDPERFAHVDMVQAIRSPGSTLKPFIYAMALEDGLIHSQSLLSDVPSNFSGYKPANFDQKFRGAVSAAHALKLSLNVPVIQLLNRISPERFEQKISTAGVSLQHRTANLAIGLGGTGIRLIDLVSLYTTFANQGQFSPLKLSQAQTTPAPIQLFTKDASWITWQMLTQIPPPDRVTRSSRRVIGWKSGTSYGHRDAWAVGVSSEYSIGVWVGRPDGTPVVGQMGAQNAAPILFDAFDLLPKEKHRLKQPDSVVQKEICWPGGMAKSMTPQELCKQTRTAWVIQGRTPPTLQTSGNFIKHHQWPSELAAWLKEKTPKEELIQIVSLRSDQHYFSDQIDALPLIANQSGSAIYWYLNDKLYTKEMLLLEEVSGEVKVTACNKTSCDTEKIWVH